MNRYLSRILLFRLLLIQALVFGRWQSFAEAQTLPIVRRISIDYNSVKGRHDEFYQMTVGAGRAA